MSARDARVVGVEALLRWRRPETEDQETLTQLIEAAERSPVIFRLENWILDQSARAAAAWPGSSPAPTWWDA